MPKLTKRTVDNFKPGADAFLWDSEVRGFGVRAKPSGEKSFVLKYRIGSRSRRYTICKVGSPYTVPEARAKAADLLRDVKDGNDPAETKAKRRDAMTVAELGDLYLEEGPAAKPNKKGSSWSNDRSMVLRHIVPLLGCRTAGDLTKADVVRFQADVAAGKSAADIRTKARGRARVTGGKRAGSLATVTLRALLQHGVDSGYIATNAAVGVVLFKCKPRERFLSEREVAILAAAVAALEDEGGLNSSMADAVRVLMISGARKSEILNLQKAWVDLARSALRLPDSKTGAKVIPLASPALAIIAERMDGASPYVFPAARGDGPTTGLTKAWTRVLAKANALAALDPSSSEAAQPFTGLRIHDLRHSFASFAVEGGDSLFLIGKVLGHRQARTTETYAHLRDDPLQAVAERAGGRIANAMKARPETANVVRFGA